MNTEPKRKDFTLSIILGYLLVFVIVIPTSMQVSDSQGIEHGLFFGALSLLFGIPIFVFVILLGFPVFRFVLLRLRLAYFLNVMCSFAVTAIATVVLYPTLLALIERQSIQGIESRISLIGIPTFIVALVSGILYWQRTRRL